MNRVQSFPPIVSERSKLIILGSMPGEASPKAGQYYAHLRNDILADHARAVWRRPLAILQSVGVALWTRAPLKANSTAPPTKRCEPMEKYRASSTGKSKPSS